MSETKTHKGIEYDNVGFSIVAKNSTIEQNPKFYALLDQAPHVEKFRGTSSIWDWKWVFAHHKGENYVKESIDYVDAIKGMK